VYHFWPGWKWQLWQLVFCGAKVQYKMLTEALPSGAGVILWRVAEGKFKAAGTLEEI
jgi:hypothetical protein